MYTNLTSFGNQRRALGGECIDHRGQVAVRKENSQRELDKNAAIEGRSPGKRAARVSYLRPIGPSYLLQRSEEEERLARRAGKRKRLGGIPTRAAPFAGRTTGPSVRRACASRIRQIPVRLTHYLSASYPERSIWTACDLGQILRCAQDDSRHFAVLRMALARISHHAG